MNDDTQTVHLGSFGTKRERVSMVFDYFGETIRVNPNATDLAFVDFMEVAKGIAVDGLDEIDDIPEAVDALRELMTGQIHPDDWDRFWQTAKDNGQFMKDVMGVSRGITEAVSGYPTGQPSDSAGGQSTTEARSSDGSLSRAERRQRERKDRKRSKKPRRMLESVERSEQARERAEEDALEQLQGRPDLQVAVLRSREARASLAS